MFRLRSQVGLVSELDLRIELVIFNYFKVIMRLSQSVLENGRTDMFPINKLC